MTRKLKICMLGATGVGKTSLVARFVRSIFSSAYLTTVGVTIDKAHVQRGAHDVDLIVWDLSGEDEFQSVQLAYLRGAAGYLLVADATRRETLATALSLRDAALKLVGEIPAIIAVNKSDLVDALEIDVDAARESVREVRDVGDSPTNDWRVVQTSAKTGEGVRDAFEMLVDEILRRDAKPGGPA